MATKPPEGVIESSFARLREIAPGPALAAELARCDNGALTDGDLVEVMAAYRRLASWAEAGELAAIAELAERRPAYPYEHELADGRHTDHTGSPITEFVTDEVAAALTLTTNAAHVRLELALDLSQRLPATRAALRSGSIDLPKAKVIARGTLGTHSAVARRVEETVLPIAPTKTTGELRAKVTRAVMAADPSAAGRQRATSEAERRVTVRDDGQGTATLTGWNLPAAPALAAANRLNALARAFKSDGDKRRLDAIRADVFLALLLGLLPTTNATPSHTAPPNKAPNPNRTPAPKPRPDFPRDPEPALTPEPGLRFACEPGSDFAPKSEPAVAAESGLGFASEPGPALELEPRPDPELELRLDLAPEPGLAPAPELRLDLAPESGPAFASELRRDPARKPGPALASDLRLDLAPESGLTPVRESGPAFASELRRDPARKPGPALASDLRLDLAPESGLTPVREPGPAFAPELRRDPARKPGPDFASELRLDLTRGPGPALAPEPRLDFASESDPGFAPEAGHAAAPGLDSVPESGSVLVPKPRLDFAPEPGPAAVASESGPAPGPGPAPSRESGSGPAPESGADLAREPGLDFVSEVRSDFASGPGVDLGDLRSAEIRPWYEEGDGGDGGAEAPTWSAEVARQAGSQVGTVQLTVPLTTYMGLADQPGEVAGYGPILADVARMLAGNADAARWCVTVTDGQGQAIAHGETAYRPSRVTRGAVEARDRTCRFPGCRRPAHQCDLDHSVPHDQGGATCPCNLSPLCRRHHRLKERRNWELHQLSPGVLLWVTPTGHWYLANPDAYEDSPA
ncbi:DUF222 domain-containing protein [Actinomadura barringtoniae]|uniref:DUF222 domain-containing protein n=1 Tax=Actinomadura barringtoniae TaxID=1427535 RepID=A0A939P660_9ACTN|nr:HNH endonuclease signature motif containing protein [Actinomadura barringtoniae]MBO2446157.1 DUF222 domain-containing protein [Actinomadura barringtoniae]